MEESFSDQEQAFFTNVKDSVEMMEMFRSDIGMHVLHVFVGLYW